MRTYRLTYRPGEGMGLVEMDKTMAELLVPNGDEPLIVYMLRTADERGLYIKLEVLS